MTNKEKQIVTEMKNKLTEMRIRREQLTKKSNETWKKIKNNYKEIERINDYYNNKLKEVWSPTWSPTKSKVRKSTTAGGSISKSKANKLAQSPSNMGKYTMYGLGALGLLAAGIYGINKLRDADNTQEKISSYNNGLTFTGMLKSASIDIYRMTMIKLSNYGFMEKLANPLGISTGAQLMRHISNSPMTFLTNLRKSIQSGKFVNNLEPLKKFRTMYGKNPNLLSMGNRMGFTGYLDNYLAKATQGIGRSITPAAVSANADRVRRAVQKSRIGSATNGIPYFGAYYA